MNEAIGLTIEGAGPDVTIVPYREEFRAAFEQLNRQWIEAHFNLEPADREILGDPQRQILDRGGQIFFVVAQGQVQGTCAVIRHGPNDCEIAKMAVAPDARGRGFGNLLMEACIAFARQISSRRIVILSNTVLEPAIRLYRKHGFVQVPLAADPRYRRANMRLELDLEPKGPAASSPE